MNYVPVLSLLILLPLGWGAVLWLFEGRIARQAAVMLSALELVLALVAVFMVDPSNPAFQLQEHAAWIPSLNIHYRLGVDGLSALFLPMTAILFVGVMLASWNAINRPLPALHYSMLLALEGITMGVFCAMDTMLFFVFWELTLLPIYFLVSLWGVGPYRRQAAIKYTILMLAGGVPLLFGLLVAALQYPEPCFNLVTLLAHPLPAKTQTLVFLLLLIGFGVKTPFFPLHTWLPTLAMEGPAGVAAVMTGLKLGAYGLLRIAIPLAPAATRKLHWLLAGLGVVGILYGAMAALAQSNLRRMLAFSSISHVGLVVLGMASMTTQGLQGVVFQLLNFTVISGGMFLLAGQIHHRFGTTDLAHLGGLARSMPRAATFFLLLGLASLGVPLTSGFPAENLLLIGAIKTYKGAGLAALGGSILGATYFLGYYQRAFWGPINNQVLAAGPDLLPHEFLFAALLGGIVILGGIFPELILNFTHVATTAWIERLVLP